MERWGGVPRRGCGFAAPHIPGGSGTQARPGQRGQAPPGRGSWGSWRAGLGGCPRGAAATYLLQQRHGVPAVVQPRGEAGRGGRVVVLGGLGDELGHGDLVRHPAAGWGWGGDTRHGRGVSRGARAPGAHERPAAPPAPGGKAGGREQQAAAAEVVAPQTPSRARGRGLGGTRLPGRMPAAALRRRGRGTARRAAAGGGGAGRGGGRCCLPETL